MPQWWAIGVQRPPLNVRRTGVPPEQRQARQVPLLRCNVVRSLTLVIQSCHVRTAKQQQVEAVQLAHGRSLMNGRVPTLAGGVQVRLCIQEHLHHRRVAIATREDEGRRRVLVPAVDLHLALQQEECALRCAPGAGVVECTAAPWIHNVQLSINLCIQLHEEEVTVECGLEDVGSLPGVLPQRDSEEFVPPETRPRRLRLVDNLHPLAEYVIEFRWLVPLRQLPRVVVEE
mmetsp:Transcript_10005/g.31133  ORF Transcript_10005/g.31133 Transcript_10005/m.31133 type:complete len:230 (+) Transcript_10005:617-1306(+)